MARITSDLYAASLQPNGDPHTALLGFQGSGIGRNTNTSAGGTGYAMGSTSPMLDLTFGGQFGWSPNIAQFVSNQSYVRRNIICLLMEAPRFFMQMPNPEIWIAALKSLVETHARTIEGFNMGLEVEWEEHPVGGAGEMQQEITNVTRARTTPSFTFVEKYGMPIQTFLQNWIQYGMMDPDTKYPLIATISNTANIPTDMLADWYTGTILVIEPDPTHTRVVKAWLTTNFMPKGTGEIIGKRDLTVAHELNTITIEFSGITQVGLGVNAFAQSVLNDISLTSANPYLRPSFLQTQDTNVAKVTNTGYAEGVATLGNSAAPGTNDTQTGFSNAGNNAAIIGPGG